MEIVLFIVVRGVASPVADYSSQHFKLSSLAVPLYYFQHSSRFEMVAEGMAEQA